MDLMVACKPGQRYAVAGSVLKRVVCPLGWKPEEEIMECILGSSYTWSFFQDYLADQVTFQRFEKPPGGNLRRYVSPDRRYLFKERADGLFEFDERYANPAEITRAGDSWTRPARG